MLKIFLIIVFIGLALAPLAGASFLDETTLTFISENIGLQLNLSPKDYTIYLIVLAFLYWIIAQFIEYIQKFIYLIFIVLILSFAYLYFI